MRKKSKDVPKRNAEPEEPSSSEAEESDSSSEAESNPEIIEPLCIHRSRRANAGNRLAALIAQQESSTVSLAVATDADEVYANAYGGFNDTNDEEMDFEPPEEDDIVDSDFDDSSDSGEEGDAEDDTDTQQKPKKRRVITGAYKEPKRETFHTVQKTKRASKPKLPLLTERPTGILSNRLRERGSALTSSSPIVAARKSRGHTDVTRRHHKTHRTPTQAQRLATARKTEEENTASLAVTMQMMMEQKRVRATKMNRRRKTEKDNGARVKYVSTRMVDKDGEPECCTYVELKDVPSFDAYFASEGRRETWRSNGETAAQCRQSKCIVSGRPAKYVDPITRIPYADVESFKMLRIAYDHYCAAVRGEVAVTGTLARAVRQSRGHIAGKMVEKGCVDDMQVLRRSHTMLTWLAMHFGQRATPLQANA